MRETLTVSLPPRTKRLIARAATESGLTTSEYVRVAIHRKLWLDAVTDLPILALYRQHAEWCEPEALSPAVCRDPDDDGVLGTAVTGQAGVIVSGDADLLALGRYSGTEIIPPRQFLARQMKPGRL